MESDDSAFGCFDEANQCYQKINLESLRPTKEEIEEIYKTAGHEKLPADFLLRKKCQNDFPGTKTILEPACCNLNLKGNYDGLLFKANGDYNKDKYYAMFNLGKITKDQKYEFCELKYPECKNSGTECWIKKCHEEGYHIPFDNYQMCLSKDLLKPCPVQCPAHITTKSTPQTTTSQTTKQTINSTPQPILHHKQSTTDAIQTTKSTSQTTESTPQTTKSTSQTTATTSTFDANPLLWIGVFFGVFVAMVFIIIMIMRFRQQ